MAEEWRKMRMGSPERKAALTADLSTIKTEFVLLGRWKLALAIRGGDILSSLKSEYDHGE